MKNFTEVSTQRCHTASAFFAVLGNSLMCPMPTSWYREKSGQESYIWELENNLENDSYTEDQGQDINFSPKYMQSHPRSFQTLKQWPLQVLILKICNIHQSD